VATSETTQKAPRSVWRTASQSTWWRGTAGWRRGLWQLVWAALRLFLGQWLWGTGLRLIFFPEPTRYVGLGLALLAGALVVWSGVALARAARALGAARSLSLLLALFAAVIVVDLLAVPSGQMSAGLILDRVSGQGIVVGRAVTDGIGALASAPGELGFAYSGTRNPPALPPGFPTPDPQATPLRAIALPSGQEPPPSFTPAPVPSSSQPSDPVGSLQIGGFARVVNVGSEPLRGRRGPGTEAAIVTRFPEGTRLLIVSGPEEADGFRWWLVRSEQGLEGWCADSWLQPSE
jgi:hypothetical protein